MMHHPLSRTLVAALFPALIVGARRDGGRAAAVSNQLSGGTMKSTIKLITGAVALGLVLPAWAGSAMDYTLPQAKSENGITYMSGGVGKPEAAAMWREARDYPLSMIFSEAKDNEFLADVQVTIKDKAGKEMLSAVSDGPIMLVKLPAGKYNVAVESHGKTLHRTVQVPAKGDRQVSFHWTQA